MNPYDFARDSRGRCFVRSTPIGNRYVNKAFCTHCPECGARLPGMLRSDGYESCLKCSYERQVFTPEELEQL